MEIKAEKKLRGLAKKLEGLISGVTPQSIYDDLVPLMKSQSEYFKMHDKDFLVNLIFYIFSYKRTGKFDLGEKMVKNLFFANFISPANENYRVTCENCNGDGDIECGRCYGSGEEDCHNCGGTGSEDCENCDGSGEVEDSNEEDVWNTCEICSGKGEVQCQTCDGDKIESCNDCHGDGRERCFDCDGTGEIDSDETVYYVYEICSWSENIYNKCELKMNTDELTLTEDEFYKFRDLYVLLHHYDDHDNLISDLEFDDLYCFLLEKEEPDLDMNAAMKIMTIGYPEFYIE